MTGTVTGMAAGFRTVWLPAALVGVMVLSAAVSLQAAFSAPTSAWLVPSSGPAVAGLAAAALARSLGGQMRRPLVVGLVVAAGCWCWLWWPDTLLLGFIPQPATAAAIADSAVALRETIWTDTIPVASSAPLLAGLGAALGLVALMTDAVALGLRSPALAGLPPLALVAGGAVITAGTAPWPALAVAASAWLGLMALGGDPVDAPQGAPRPAAGLGTVVAGVVAVLALVASLTTLPFLSSGLAPEGQRFLLGQGAGPVNPAADLGQDLRSNRGFSGISYETEDGLGVYLRTAVVDDVAASPWDATPPQYAGDPTTTGFAPAAERMAREAEPGQESGSGKTPEWDRVSVTLDGWSGNWAPLPDQVWALEDIAGDWGWQVDPSTSTAYRAEAVPAELTYQTAVLPLELTFEELADRAGGLAPQGVFNRWGADPDLQGSAIQTIAEDLTADTDNSVEQAVALQDYLLSDRFTYSETAPVDQGYDGSGIEMTEQFLESGAGYCIHFSSAMVMMAQSVDIPARVVVGYAPVGSTNGVHEVTSDRAHAWPELYIDEVGWVPFEPTKGVGRVPTYARGGSTGDPTPSADPTAGDPESSPAGSPGEERNAHDAGSGADGGSVVFGAWGGTVGPVLVGLGVLAVVALLLCVPRWVRRRRRRARLGSGSVHEVWAELEDTAVDVGLGRQPHESEPIFTARLAADPEASTVADAIVWARYAAAGTPAPGGAGPDGAAPDGAAPVEHVAGTAARAVRAITASLEADAEPAVRRRARWFPRSLVPRESRLRRR